MKLSRLHLAGLLAVTAAGAALRVYPIASRPLWFDEAADWLSCAKSGGIHYRQFFLWTHDFEAAPFTFLLRRIFMDAFGSEAVWVQRLPAVLCAVACIPVAFWLGCVIRSATLGLIVAALLALDPSMVDLGQQSRSYPMLTLLTLLAMVTAIKVLRPTASVSEKPHGFSLWLVLGVILGLLFCTTQFGIAVWFGLGLAAAGLVVAGRLTGQPHPQAKRIVIGFILACLLAVLISAPGLWNLATKDTARGWGANMSYPAIAREIVVAAKDLIDLTPAGLLLYVFAAAGLWLLFRRCKTSAAVVACVALANVLMLFPFRKSHHFMAPRYLSLIQPAIWVGLAMLAVEFPLPRPPSSSAVGSAQKWLCRLGVLALALYFSANIYHSVNLESWYTGPDTHKYLASPKIIALRDRLEPGAAVVYQPVVLKKVGRYYGVPIDPLLDAGFYENDRDRPDPKIPPDFHAPVTYLVVGMVGEEKRIAAAKKVIELLAAHYHADLGTLDLNRHIRKYRVAIVRFAPDHVEITSFP